MWSAKVIAHLLVGIHACKATSSASLPSFGSDVLNLFLGAISKVSGVGVVGHRFEFDIRCDVVLI